MAKHFNQPLPAVPTIYFFKAGLLIKKKLFKTITVILEGGKRVVGERNRDGEGQWWLLPKDVLQPLCLLNKLSTFWFFTC